MNRSEQLGSALAEFVILFLGKPLLLICGLNWLLETQHQQVPYTVATWFGATLVIRGFRLTTAKKV